MAHTKHQAWREMKRAGQIDRTGLVRVVSDEAAANEITDADFAAADLEYATNKAQRRAEQNISQAKDLQLNGSGVRS